MHSVVTTTSSLTVSNCEGNSCEDSPADVQPNEGMKWLSEGEAGSGEQDQLASDMADDGVDVAFDNMGRSLCDVTAVLYDEVEFEQKDKRMDLKSNAFQQKNKQRQPAEEMLRLIASRNSRNAVASVLPWRLYCYCASLQ